MGLRVTQWGKARLTAAAMMVSTMERRTTTVAMARVLENMFFNCFTGPIRNSVLMGVIDEDRV